MKPAIGFLLFLTAFPLAAQDVFPPPEAAPVLHISGPRPIPIPIKGQAVGFSLLSDRRGVNISAHLGNGGGRAWADAYLMKEIGPATTEQDEVARIAFELGYPFDGWVDLFTNLDLEQGTYWLVIARPRETAHSSINWFAAQPLADGTCMARYVESRSYTFETDAAEYIPASKFEKKFEHYKFELELWEMRQPGAEPCPAQ